jgi:DNA mismatch repair protein MutS2
MARPLTPMDQHTLDLLEFPKIRELLAGYCGTSLGKELARQIEPGQEFEQIRSELQLVTEMTEALASGMTPPLGGLSDIRLLIRRAALGSMLNPTELLEVRDVLLCTGQVYRYRMRLDQRWTALNALLARVEDLGLVAKCIEGSLDSRGGVLDMASPELAAVRQRLKEIDDKAQEHVRRLLRDPELRKVLRYQNATMSGDHYLLPVAVNHRHRVQGVVHRTSSTGETVFIEPASLARLSAERALIKSDEDKEVARILRKLTAEVAHVVRPLHTAIEVLARLDLITAKARFSLDYHMTEPDLNAVGRLWLRAARHPLLEYLFRTRPVAELNAGISSLQEGWKNGRVEGAPRSEGASPGAASILPSFHPCSSATTTSEPSDQRQVVPIDVRLGAEFNLLVITGPNTGGKTVALKTTGLLSLMALAGMHIPAGQGSQVPVWHHVLADIGDEQSLEQSLSTFSSHISRIADILAQADEQSLVLLDELGAGTDPTEGAALGRAILDELDRLRCRAMVTTHLGDLKTYAFVNERAENAAVEFDVETLRPTYHLRIGQFGMSNALKIARRLRLPRELLRRAHHYLRRRQRRTPELLKLQQAREQAEQARQQALEATLQARQEQTAYEERRLALQREAEEREALRAARSNLKPGDVVRLVKLDQPGQIVRIDVKRNLAVVQAGIGQWEVPLEEVLPV